MSDSQETLVVRAEKATECLEQVRSDGWSEAYDVGVVLALERKPSVYTKKVMLMHLYQGLRQQGYDPLTHDGNLEWLTFRHKGATGNPSVDGIEIGVNATFGYALAFLADREGYLGVEGCGPWCGQLRTRDWMGGSPSNKYKRILVLTWHWTDRNLEGLNGADMAAMVLPKLVSQLGSLGEIVSSFGTSPTSVSSIENTKDIGNKAFDPAAVHEDMRTFLKEHVGI